MIYLVGSILVMGIVAWMVDTICDEAEMQLWMMERDHLGMHRDD